MVWTAVPPRYDTQYGHIVNQGDLYVPLEQVAESSVEALDLALRAQPGFTHSIARGLAELEREGFLLTQDGEQFLLQLPLITTYHRKREDAGLASPVVGLFCDATVSSDKQCDKPSLEIWGKWGEDKQYKIMPLPLVEFEVDKLIAGAGSFRSSSTGHLLQQFQFM